MLRVSGISYANIYRPVYRNITFLNQQIFVSVSALKILYRSGSNCNIYESTELLLLRQRQ